MNRIALLLRKDMLVLRRSPLLLGILIAYPLAIALLIGLVASYGSSKPRVAFVDEDNLPATVVLGGKRFDVGHTIDEASKKVKLVRLSPDEAKRQLDDGRVVAVVTVPPGFVSTLRGMVRSPQLELQLSTGTISSRVEQQVQALVYSLNRQLQSAYIASNLRYVTLILHGGDGSFLGAPITVLGIEKAQRLLREMPQTPKTAALFDFLHDARLALANTNDALSSTAHPIELVRAPARGRTWALSAEVQAYALALTITFLALLLAAGSLAAERDENVVGRLARGLVGLGQLVWSKVALAAAVALALGLAIALGFGLIIEIGGVTGGEPWRRLPLLVVGLALAAAVALALGLAIALGFGLIIEIGGVTGGEPWRRLPLLVVGLVLAGGSVGALGALLGALAREARSASLVAVLVVMPIVFLGLIPAEVVPPAGWLSDALPFAHAVRFFRSALYDLSPWGAVLREGLWLVALGVVFGGLARVGARRLLV